MYITKDLKFACSEQKKKIPKQDSLEHSICSVCLLRYERFTFFLYFYYFTFPDIFIFKNNNSTRFTKAGEKLIILIKFKVNYVATSLNYLGLN